VESLDTASLRVTWSNPDEINCTTVGNLQYVVSWSEGNDTVPYNCSETVYKYDITDLRVSGGQYNVTVGSDNSSIIAEQQRLDTLVSQRFVVEFVKCLLFTSVKFVLIYGGVCMLICKS
jgi:hypothetical protein